jgi:SAM-dependent methyltransferase
MLSERTLPFRKKVKFNFLKYFLKGKNVECSICEQKYMTFLPFGVKHKRSNALCLNCFSLERHRLVWLFIKNKTTLLNSKSRVKLFHVAPESAFFKHFRKNKMIDYYPVDLFEEGYSYPKGTINMDITAINYDNESFDVVICNHVLEHIPDDKKALSELYRILKKDGWAILLVPIEKDLEHTFEDPSITDSKGREEAYGQSDHVRQYGRDYASRLENSGFKVTINKFNDTFSREEKFRYGLPKDTDIYYCTK